MAKRIPKSKDDKKSYYDRKKSLPPFSYTYNPAVDFTSNIVVSPDGFQPLSAASLKDAMQRMDDLTTTIQQQNMALNPTFTYRITGLSGSNGNRNSGGGGNAPQTRIQPDGQTLYRIKDNRIGECGVAESNFRQRNQAFSRYGLRVAVNQIRPSTDQQGNFTMRLENYYIVDDQGQRVDRSSGCFYETDIDFGGGQTATSNAKKEIDPKQLDRVVLKEDVKEEIIAVLQQHKHAATIFDDWGLADVIEYGRGMTFLFHGKPGTGKTWAANCMAKAMGVDLLTIGAAEIQTSEPGGANRNIINAFKAAKDKNSVLFLDECDSLITNRTHVGMIIGSEINTLLTEIEKFEGVVILATNRIGSLDEALARRISLIVEFPAPTQVERMAIWTKMLPEKMPLHKDVSIEDLSAFALTGGQIKNAVLQAARLAVSGGGKSVEKKHFEKAIDRIQNSHDLFGKEDHYIQVKKDIVSST